MPKSKVRKKAGAAPSVNRREPVKVKAAGPSHPIYVAVMLGVIVLGIAWLVVSYLAPDIPFMAPLGAWNLLVGFALMIIGLLMTMRWR